MEEKEVNKNKCILISEKDYNDLKNEIEELKKRDVKYTIELKFDYHLFNTSYCYGNHKIVFDDCEMFDLSAENKGKIKKVTERWKKQLNADVKQYCEDFYSKIVKQRIDDIKDNIENFYLNRKDELSFFERIVADKTLKRINEIIK